jgi:hypothetical protein
MAFELEILTIGVGVIYGYLKPGKEDRVALLKNGFLIGIVLGLVVAVFGMLVDSRVLSHSGVAVMIGLVGMFVFILAVILAVLFILGTLIGDWLEEKSKAQ